jgi:hypothetical protein
MLCHQSNDTALLVLSTDTVSVDDGFLTKVKTAFFSCLYVTDEKTRWKGHGLIKSSGGLYTYHGRLVIPRAAQDLRILMLTDCHDNVGHHNWRRLLATLLKRFYWERMSFDCDVHFSNCVFAIELSRGDMVLHHCLLWVCLITLEKSLAWILLRTSPKVPNTI